jgi:hypothetical protein
LVKEKLKDSSFWSSAPLVLLREIRTRLLMDYDWKDSAPPQSQNDVKGKTLFRFIEIIRMYFDTSLKTS